MSPSIPQPSRRDARQWPEVEDLRKPQHFLIDPERGRSPTLAFAFACLVGVLFAPAALALPEPGLTVFGELLGALPAVSTNASLTWTHSSGALPAVTPATWIVVNGATFHLARVPFETRQLAGGLRLDASPNTLELPPAPATFTRVASLAGRPLAFVNPTHAKFTFGPADRGRSDRVDLRLVGSPEPVDTDGDGSSDEAEAIAGTDPRDPRSVLKLNPGIRPSDDGSLVLQWSGVPGRRYTVSRSTDLARGFTVLQRGIPAAGETTTFRDPVIDGPGPFFYRIAVE